MPATYEPLATTTLGSAASSVTFSSISGSYTDLVVVFSGTAGGGNSNLILTFNSDTGSNYSWTDRAEGEQDEPNEQGLYPKWDGPSLFTNAVPTTGAESNHRKPFIKSCAVYNHFAVQLNLFCYSKSIS